MSSQRARVLVMMRGAPLPEGGRALVLLALEAIRILSSAAAPIHLVGKHKQLRDPRTALDAALADAEPTAFKAASGMPARLVAVAATGAEVVLTWPAAAGGAAQDPTWRITVTWPLAETDDVRPVIDAFATFFDPDRLELGPCRPRGARLAEAWLVASPPSPGAPVSAPRFPLGRLHVEVAHDGSPISPLPEHVEARRSLLARGRGGPAPGGETPTRELAEPTRAPPSPPSMVKHAPRVSDDTVPVGSFLPSGLALPFVPPVVSAAAPQLPARPVAPRPASVVAPTRGRVDDSTLDVSAMGNRVSFDPPFLRSSGEGIEDEPTAAAASDAERHGATATPGRVGLPLSLEQYSAFQAELRREGGLTRSIADRYGVPTEAAQRALQEAFRAAFLADPVLGERFVALMRERIGG